MGHRERDIIKEYLVERFCRLGTFSYIEENSAFGISLKESKRCISLYRGEDKFLVVVHSSAHYNPNQKTFLKFLQEVSKEGIACVSVFDDGIFYKKDDSLHKYPKDGSRKGIHNNIKLSGLELIAQNLGIVNYYRQEKKCLERVKFNNNVVSDYRDSTKVFAREVVKTRELLTIMSPRVLEHLTDFDLEKGAIVSGVYTANFVVPNLNEKEKDQRIQFILDEIAGGNREILEQITGPELNYLRAKGIRI